MKIIFHHRFYQVYSSDPAAARGRMEAMVNALEGKYDFIEPEPASERDLEQVHGSAHIQQIQRDPLVYEVGCLAAGGAILAAEMAFEGEPALVSFGRRAIMPVRIPAGGSVISTTWRSPSKN